MAHPGREGGADRETVIVERSGGGGIIAAVALVIAAVAVLHYLDLLPF